MWRRDTVCVQDFHTAIAGTMTDEEYARELYSAMLEDAQQALLNGHGAGSAEMCQEG